MRNPGTRVHLRVSLRVAIPLDPPTVYSLNLLRRLAVALVSAVFVSTLPSTSPVGAWLRIAHFQAT